MNFVVNDQSPILLAEQIEMLEDVGLLAGHGRADPSRRAHRHVRFEVAHGQLDEQELERRMLGFLRGEADVLVDILRSAGFSHETDVITIVIADGE